MGEMLVKDFTKEFKQLCQTYDKILKNVDFPTFGITTTIIFKVFPTIPFSR